MSHGFLYVVPPGQEGLLRGALDTEVARSHGWTFLGAQAQGRQIRAVYRHRASGKLAHVVLTHPTAQPNPSARTKQFAIMLHVTVSDDAARELLADITRALGGIDQQFVWSSVGAGGGALPPDEDASRSSSQTLQVFAPAISRFLAAHGASDPDRQASALEELLRLRDAAPSTRAAALAMSHVLTLARRYSEAIVILDEAIRSAPKTEQIELLKRQFEIAEHLGWKTEAISALNQLIDITGVEAFGMAVRFYTDRHDPEVALPYARVLAERDVAHRLRSAEVMAEAGLDAEAREIVARAIQQCTSSEEHLKAARIFAAIGDFANERRHLEAALEADPACVPALTRLAQLCLWQGEYSRAFEHVTRTLRVRPGDAAALRYRGAYRLFQGDPPGALADLDEAARLDERDFETMVLRGEALFYLGRRDEAQRELTRALGLIENTFAPLDVLVAFLRAQEGEYGASRAPFLSDFVDKLPVSPAALARVGLSVDVHHETPRETLERWLRTIRGNRSAVMTTWSDEHGLRRLRDSDNMRTASFRAQDALLTRPTEAALARFEPVLADHPGKPYPYCYRGEVLLWLGRYEEARRDFLAAIALREDTRWAYVGLGAVELFSERPERAVETLELGIHKAKGAGPTTFAYRGEAFRLLGDLDRAIADLTQACGEAPMRVGAWINLALAREAAGDMQARDKICARLNDIAPGLMSEARADLALEAVAPTRTEHRLVLERARQMMRGNRSSRLGTWFNAAGALRVVAWAPRDQDGNDVHWLRMMTGQ